MTSTLARIILFSFFISLFIPHLTSAETKTFIKEYTYQASELDSKASCRIIALEQIKRILLEELGTYLENYTEIKKFQLTKDKITAFSAGVVQAEVLDEKWDGKSYWLKAEIKADPANVVKSIENLRKDQQKMEDLEKMKRNQDEALKEIEKLRSEMVLLKYDITAREKFNKNVEALRTENDVDRQNNCSDRTTQKTAALTAQDWKSLLQMSIDFIPACRGVYDDDSIASNYEDMAIAYYQMGNYKEALKASDKGVETSYKEPGSHTQRGVALIALNNLADSFKSLNIAEKLAKHAIENVNRHIKYLEITKNNYENLQLYETKKGSYQSRIYKYKSMLDYIEALKKKYKIGNL
jgi:tetratricopeptide (TPR) repeat protein